MVPRIVNMRSGKWVEGIMRKNPLHYRIKNWDLFQHYKDRNPTWVKLHYETLSSADWVGADDETRVLMVVCMLVASRHGGQVPNDAGYLKRVGYLNFDPTFDKLLKLGFLMPPKYLRIKDIPVRNARPETETYSKETDSKNLVGSATPKPTRAVVYDLGFEQFWKGYPTDRLMSKKVAASKWARLSPEDRKLAIDSLAQFRAYCASRPDYRPVHAERYIGQRRFDGFGGPVVEGVTLESLMEQKDKASRMGIPTAKLDRAIEELQATR